MTLDSTKACFVISPIGSPESDMRRYADKFLRFIVRHSLGPSGYKVFRADEISEPGTINLQVIRALMDSKIVIADLTGTNPNVMYELAIRHAIKKPAILMVSAGQKLPFDIMTERTIFFNISEIESIENARAELARQVGFIESNQFDIGSPFSLTEDVIVRASTGNPLDKDIATIAGDLAYLKSALSNALAEIRPERQRPNRIRTMTSTGKWIKIIVELVEPPSSVTLEISPEDSVFDSLSAIWGLQSIDAKFRPPAYTYLWDWILVRKRDQLPLLIMGVMNLIPARLIFKDGERWQVVSLKEPILHQPERFSFQRGMSDRW